MPLLNLKNIYKSFDEIKVLQGSSLSIDVAEIVGLVGESGCGKTTLAKIIAGLEYVDAGEISWYESILSERRSQVERREIQMIFQNAGGSFNPKFTIENSLSQPLIVHDRYSSELIDQVISDVGLSVELKHRYPHQLSGGQMQRMAIARAIILKPSLVIADEPTSALDMKSKIQILELISILSEKYNLSFLIITHDIMSLKNIADKCAVMHKGQIVEEGCPKEIINNPQKDYTKGLIQAIPVLP